MSLRSLVWILLLCQLVLGDPLLKVPKVYNALITTDQNLATSRAYPVIQPVIHRTAIGYSPPFYYQPGAPGYGAGYGPNYGPTLNAVPGQQAPAGPEGGDNPDVENIDVDQPAGKKSKNDDDRCKEPGAKGQVPLSFYPNHRSLFYDPYFYHFNAFPAFPTPGNYFFNYPHGFPGPHGFVPQGFPAAPGPAAPPRPPQETPTATEDKEEAKSEEKTDAEEVTEDVPPPPVNTRRRAVNRSI